MAPQTVTHRTTSRTRHRSKCKSNEMKDNEDHAQQVEQIQRSKARSGKGLVPEGEFNMLVVTSTALPSTLRTTPFFRPKFALPKSS